MPAGKMRRMVSPEGEVWEIDPSEVPKAIANKFVDFGSPQHMAQLGVPGPMSPVNTPTADMPGPSTNLIATESTGAVKGLANTGLGMARLLAKVPGLNRAPGLQPAQMDADAANLEPQEGEKTGYYGEQAGEFLLPGMVGSRVAKAIPVAERVMQNRNVAGQFLKATRSPVLRDLIRRAAAGMGTTAAATGGVNAAQGGDLRTGVMAGGAGELLGLGSSVALPYLKSALKSRALLGLLSSAGGSYGGYAGATGHVPGADKLPTLAVGAGMFYPPTRRLMTGGGLNLLDRMSPGEKRRVAAHAGMVSNAEGAGYR